MPCKDYEGDSEMRERLDKLTRMLCGLCQRLEREHSVLGFFTKYPELSEWWKEHKKQDAQREHLEALMQAKALIESGWAGVNSKGTIVDRRTNPDAVPIPENKMFNTPKPK